jgi:pyridoxal phosphate enzyme (YggS family)
MMSVTSQLAEIRSRLGSAALIAVSKTRPVEDIQEALRAGQSIFGENRVQEAKTKFPPLRQTFPDLELHLIGPLQTNKALDAVEIFDVIETLDRTDLADALAKAIRKKGRSPRLYLEINIGEEPQKTGVTLSQLDPFLSYCRETCGLTVSGLMCIPPHGQDPRPFFDRMRHEKERLSLPHLSMGMSGDYELAIACGATEVRVGSALFGERAS